MGGCMWGYPGLPGPGGRQEVRAPEVPDSGLSRHQRAAGAGKGGTQEEAGALQGRAGKKGHSERERAPAIISYAGQERRVSVPGTLHPRIPERL